MNVNSVLAVDLASTSVASVSVGGNSNRPTESVQPQNGESFAPQSRVESLRWQEQQIRSRLSAAYAHEKEAAFDKIYKNGSITVEDSIGGFFSFGERRVSGPFRAVELNPANPIEGDYAEEDAKYNGEAYRIVARDVDSNATPVIFVNGIKNELAKASRIAGEISRLTGSPIDLAYNSSSVNVALRKALDHFIERARVEARAAAPRWLTGIPRDAWIRSEANRRVVAYAFDPNTADWAKRNVLHNPPTAQTTANLILEQLNNTDGLVSVVGFSQGGAIVAEALRRLEAKGFDVGRVRVLAVAAAADTGTDAVELTNDFPNSVRVSGFAHKNDVISQYFGQNRRNLSTWAVWSYGLDRGRWTQHRNYFRGDQSNKPPDPKAEKLLQLWHQGKDFQFQLLDDLN